MLVHTAGSCMRKGGQQWLARFAMDSRSTQADRFFLCGATLNFIDTDLDLMSHSVAEAQYITVARRAVKLPRIPSQALSKASENDMSGGRV